METIVVQESDAAIREVIRLTLEAEDFNVLALKECDVNFLPLIERANSSLIILDFRISGKECVENCQLIKASYPSLPVVAMSCNSKIKNIYRHYGFDGYIEKPFDLDVLCQTVKQYVKAATSLC